MPMQRDLYPLDWDAIAHMVKVEADWKCEECGKECKQPDEDLIDFIIRTVGGLHSIGSYERLRHPKKWELGVAHLDHIPAKCHRSNLKALCTQCHCRMDLKAMPLKKHLRRERNGQLTLNLTVLEGDFQ